MGLYRNNNGVIENLTPTAPPAIGIQYDNTSSELEATNVQDAVDEVVEVLDGKQDKLTNPLTQSDVVNNLTSTDTNVPLSAAQGKALNDKFNGLFKTGTYTGTTSAAGTIGIDQRPEDCSFIVCIVDNSQAGGYYIVRYHNYVFGAFSYAEPHLPLANGTITLTYIYI